MRRDPTYFGEIGQMIVLTLFVLPVMLILIAAGIAWHAIRLTIQFGVWLWGTLRESLG